MSGLASSFSDPAADLSLAFAGDWHVYRTVFDHLTQRPYSFKGKANIGVDAFVERGEVTIDDRSFSAARTYRLDGSAGVITVLFPDGRPFVRLGTQPSQRIEHHCGDDLYVGHLFFISPDLWTEHWRVRGPRKHYTSLTRFVRSSLAIAGS